MGDCVIRRRQGGREIRLEIHVDLDIHIYVYRESRDCGWFR